MPLMQFNFNVKPCPFCGSQDLDIQVGTEDKEGFPTNVVCVDCGACGPWVYKRMPFKDFELPEFSEWNKRV